MGGVVEGGVGIACITSPQRAAIEKVQAELRKEYNVRDKTKRELEFLEKGGNPLDLLKPLNAVSVSVQSTSSTDRPDQFITGEAKGGFVFTVSPHGDSVESSGGHVPNPYEANSADNLMLFDAENEFSEGDRSLIVPSEKLSQMDGSHGTQERGGSAAFGLPRKAYKRRYRSHPDRDGTMSSSTDVNPTHDCHGSSLPSRHDKDLKRLMPDTENQKVSINCNANSTCPIDGSLKNTGLMDNQQDMVLNGGKAVELTKNLLEGIMVEAASDAKASETPLDDQYNQQAHSGDVKSPMQMGPDGTETPQAKKEMTSALIECQSSGTANKIENQSSSCQMNGVSSKNGMKNDAHNINGSHGLKGLDSESSCNQTIITIGGNNDGEMCTMRNAVSNGKIKDQTLVPDGTLVIEGDEFVKEKRETGAFDDCTLNNMESTSACQSQHENSSKLQFEEELNQSGSATKNEVKGQFVIGGMETCEPNGSETGRKPFHTLVDHPGLHNENSCIVKNQDLIDTSISDLPNEGSLTRISTVSVEAQTPSYSDSKLEIEIDADSILKEAQIIETKRRRIVDLSIVTSPRKVRSKSHWDYVLEEMAWLANDFAQERVWKIDAAAQICFRAAFTCRLGEQEKDSSMETKKVARTLAKYVMEFWHSVEETRRVLEQESREDVTFSIQAYAVRYLKYNNSNPVLNQADVPLTPDRVSDMGIIDLSWEDSLAEENLFYRVPPGAMEAYKISIESHVTQRERMGYNVLEEAEMSSCDATADFESQDTAYDEDEGETNAYSTSMAFEASKFSRYGQKKRKHLIHTYGVRSYEVSPDMYAENQVLTQRSALLAKWPGGSLNVSIPTKRVRTASRKIIIPFGAGASVYIQVPSKTDALSGDTNSFQDDQTTMHGGSLVPNSLEVGDFDKQLRFDSSEFVSKHNNNNKKKKKKKRRKKKKKEKKAKHLSAAYEPRWQAGSAFEMEQFQRDNLRSHRPDSNSNSCLFVQPIIKKPKIMGQSQDSTFENIAPVGGSASSPVASQMSNMSNPKKFVKMLGGRYRARKPKVLKMPAGQLGSGSPWTLFEDQALVVLAHDMGPNWDLISDVINSTLQFKCIFRNAKECKERHNFLMDRNSGDGADSAEDSGSSQSYPSALPGIPKGSARKLFQLLQGPMEEETLKSHFEKIIIIGQKQEYHKTQEPRQIQQPHSSHTVALSQVCPNNLNGGPVLTPLDLCDVSISGPEMLPIGYQVPRPGGIVIPNEGSTNQMHPASGSSSTLQGSPNMLGNNFSSSPSSLNSSMRYGVPRSASLSADEQQRMEQYSQMITSRNIPEANISAGALSGSDCGVRILPGGNSMGLVCGVNRSMPLARPGFQGIASPSIGNSGSMVFPDISSTNTHSGLGSGQGSAMLRPREVLHTMQPGPSPDSQRQMMAPDVQMHVSPGNSQISDIGGLSSPFPNKTASATVSSYPLHHQPSHPISPQQPQVLGPHHPHFHGPANQTTNHQLQAYAIRLAKERQQQRFLKQQQLQQPQFAASSSLISHVQPHHQLPISSPAQNSPQVQPQTGSPPVSLSPLTPVSSLNSMPQHQQKHQTPTQGVARNAQAGGSGLTNQTSKQRQRQQQQLSQTNRQHPQQQQQAQAQQPAKVAEGVGRGDLMMHQNTAFDPSIANGVSTSPGNQCSEKRETATHLIPNQGLYTGAVLNTMQPTMQYASSPSSSQSLARQKNCSGQAASSTKHLHQMTSHSDNSSQGHVPAVAPGLSASHQSVSSMAMAVSNNQQTSSHQKLVNQNQLALQRMQPNRLINYDASNKLQARDSDADQQSTSSSTEVDTLRILPQTINSSTNVEQVASFSASSHQWLASEPLLEANEINSATNLNSSVSVPPNYGESATHIAQGLGHKPSASLPSSRHDVTAQWQQQQPPQLQRSNSPVAQHQQPPPPLHSQQREQLLQSGKGNLCGRSGDHRLE